MIKINLDELNFDFVERKDARYVFNSMEERIRKYVRKLSK